jgi:hypothetical protein
MEDSEDEDERHSESKVPVKSATEGLDNKDSDGDAEGTAPAKVQRD